MKLGISREKIVFANADNAVTHEWTIEQILSFVRAATFR
jgi:hypothetical protein